MPTISDFWLSGKLLCPDEDERPAHHYSYAVEYSDTGVVVHRFRYHGDLALWLASADTTRRERVRSRDPLVRAALRADEWPYRVPSGGGYDHE
jgi:hypothetical protein